MLLKSGFFQLKKITKCPSFLWLEDLHKVLYAWIYSLLDYCHISYLRISLPPASPNCADYRYFNPEKLQISDLKTDDEFCKHSTWRVWTCNSVCTGLRRSRPSRFSSSPWCRDTLLSLTCSKTKQKKGLRTKYTKSYLFFVAQIQITVLTPTDQNLLKFAVDIQTHFHLCLSYSNFTSIFFSFTGSQKDLKNLLWIFSAPRKQILGMTNCTDHLDFLIVHFHPICFVSGLKQINKWFILAEHNKPCLQLTGPAVCMFSVWQRPPVVQRRSCS